MGIVKQFRLGEHFTEEEYHKWKGQLEWWIKDSMPKIDDPPARAEAYLISAMNGTKLNGEAWPNISNDFFKRVRQIAGFDLEAGIGVRRSTANRPRTHRSANEPKVTVEDLPPIDMSAAVEDIQQYKLDLLAKYPHLENPVYGPKVAELAETIIKSRLLSQEFMLASGNRLERLSKIRESLHKQIGELMDFLEISPRLLMHRKRESEKSDVGSLIAQLESYGTVWQEFERLDALRELLQKYKMLNSVRPDGTPQLNDWELWHQTRNRPVRFKCRCGEEYELLGGFTPEEIEQALLQSQKVYGFGLEPIEGSNYRDTQTIGEEVLDGTWEIVQQPEEEDEDTTSGD